MKKLRTKFWDRSKELIDWCCDEELRVLRQRAGEELESRLLKITNEFDQSEEIISKKKKAKIKKNAKINNKRLPQKRSIIKG